MRPANDTDVTPAAVVDAAGPDEEALAGQGFEEPREGAFDHPEIGVAEEVEVTVVTEAQDDEEEAEPAEEAEPVEAATEEAPEAAEAAEAKEGEEPQSFLAMYFRDMAELDVLRPEQEFETARHIEELELDLWRHPAQPAGDFLWVADHVEKAIMRPLAELKPYRALAEKAKAGSRSRHAASSTRSSPRWPRSSRSSTSIGSSSRR